MVGRIFDVFSLINLLFVFDFLSERDYTNYKDFGVSFTIKHQIIAWLIIKSNHHESQAESKAF